MEQELGAIRSRSDEEQDQEDAHHGRSDEEEDQGRTTSKKMVKKRRASGAIGPQSAEQCKEKTSTRSGFDEEEGGRRSRQHIRGALESS